MKRCNVLITVLAGFAANLTGTRAIAQDWPQWRGENRDAKAAGFKAPARWPQELKKDWKVSVGDGVSTPALVGDKLYVFAMQGGNEILRCLSADTGKEIWKDEYPAQGATGPASRFAGPRSSPTVSGGKVVVLGVRGIVSCYDAANGTKLWRKEDLKGTLPRFFTSCSPIVEDGMCIVQLGSENRGAIIAYDLATGAEKWRWSEEGTAYASPTLLTVDGTKVLVAETDKSIVALGLGDGKLLWQTPFVVKGRGYNASTPMVDGHTVIFSGSGRGVKAIKIEKKGAALAGTELWSNPENSVMYNTPVLRDGVLYGITDRDVLFCIDAKSGKTAWTSQLKGQRGYGSVVDVGSALLALTPSGQMIVFEPNNKEFKQAASYKVAEGDTFAYPVASGRRVYIKDRESVAQWSLPQ